MLLQFDQRKDSGIWGGGGNRASNEPNHEAVFSGGKSDFVVRDIASLTIWQ